MNPFEIFRVAIHALRRNKTRSFLTTLGIMIGIAAVIAMVAMGEGTKAMVEQSFASMGTNLLIILPGSSSSGGAQGGYGSQPTLTWSDLKAIQSELATTVRYVAPVFRTSSQVASEEQNWGTQVQGTTPDYFEIRTWKVSRGTRFTDSDVEGANKVVVLGATVAEHLFGQNADPVGQLVRIRNIPFQVVAVLEKKGQSPTGQDYDDAVLIPVTTFQTKIQGGLTKYLTGAIMVSAASPEATPRAQSQITNLLRDRHHIAAGQDDDFQIRNLQEVASAAQDSTQTMTTLLAGIAAVSLVVGGIGIMNIMLVSVTERTREIGVRMAIGAKPRDILLQFLVEALTLSVAGGLVGIALGFATAQQLARVLHWPLLLRPDVVVISVLFSALVGVGFGLYPARKASLLDPIEALRYE